MNKKRTLRKILSYDQTFPGKSFYQRMENAPWTYKELKMSNRPVRSTRFVWQFAIGIVIVLAILSISIPSVRASLSAWLGLSVAPSNQMPAQAVTLLPVSTAAPAVVASTEAAPEAAKSVETQVSAAFVEQPAEVQALSSQVGWDVLSSSRLPQGYHFLSAYFDTNNQMAILTFVAERTLPGSTDTTTKSINLLEALKNDFVPMQVAPDASVEDILVNGQPGAYIQGAWDTQFVPDTSDPNGGRMVSTWRNDLKIQNVYWQNGKTYLLLVSDDETLTRQDLIDMMAGVGK